MPAARGRYGRIAPCRHLPRLASCSGRDVWPRVFNGEMDDYEELGTMSAFPCACRLDHPLRSEFSVSRTAFPFLLHCFNRRNVIGFAPDADQRIFMFCCLLLIKKSKLTQYI